jgi:hypothetical protein
MKAVLYFATLGLLLLAACTAPTQKIAVVAMQRGMDHTQSIVLDLANESKQSALNLGAIEVEKAASAGDSKAAVAALSKAFNKCNKIGWLQIQNERSFSELRVAQMYIASQEGILDILYNEFKAAKAQVDAPTSQPATQENPQQELQKLIGK